jgi:hypothetical protein
MGHSVELLVILSSLDNLASQFRSEDQTSAANLLNATQGLLRTYFFPDGGAHLDAVDEIADMAC